MKVQNSKEKHNKLEKIRKEKRGIKRGTIVLILFPFTNAVFISLFLLSNTDQFINLLLILLLFTSATCFIETFFWSHQRIMKISHSEQPPKKLSPSTMKLYSDDELSFFFLVMSQSFYCYIFITIAFLGLVTLNIIIIVFLWIYLGISSIVFATLCGVSIIGYLEAVDLKENALRDAKQKFESLDENDYNAKIYYLNLITELQRRPLFTVSAISKLLAFFTILLAVVPFIS